MIRLDILHDRRRTRTRSLRRSRRVEIEVRQLRRRKVWVLMLIGMDVRVLVVSIVEGRRFLAVRTGGGRHGRRNGMVIRHIIGRYRAVTGIVELCRRRRW